uniref:Integrase core domain-containing protein n=1 Tax=Amphimedon queenslandica TaxID=400682 RepID=A0A1X7U275_AMPQE
MDYTRLTGPNFLWHLDKYDKLTPYGIVIHGCIDGYSRKILWWKVGSANNDPHIIGHYYIEAVKSIKNCLSILWSDLGTENSIVSIIQPVLRHHDSESLAGAKNFLY